MEALGAAPADQRDLELVGKRPDRDRVVGAVRTRDADATFVDEIPKAVRRVLRRSLGQTVLGMQHELERPVEQPLFRSFVERESMNTVITAARTVEG